MRTSLLDYELPEHLIARHPAEQRDGARLLLVEPHATPDLGHRRIVDLPSLVAPGTVLVVNNTRVIPARLFGKKEGSGGQVELLLVRRTSSPDARNDVSFLALGRASKRMREGTWIEIDGGDLRARVERRDEAEGLLLVTLRAASGDVFREIEARGHVPLPPYLRRPDEASDRERYQTIFAEIPGAIAAPTAGLHLSREVVRALREAGATICSITLHVGLGTFQPVEAADLNDHKMHVERFEVPAATVDAIRAARARGSKVAAVGTTVVRALESAADPERVGHVRAMAGETQLLIQPGYSFRVVDQLLTNFHLPRSTLLALVFAFAGPDLARRAYEEAIRSAYRFYSYGDAMWIAGRT